MANKLGLAEVGLGMAAKPHALASIELVSANYNSDRSGMRVPLPPDRDLPIAASSRP